MYLKGSEITRRESVSYGVAVSNVSNRVMEQCASLAVLATFHGKKVVARKSIQHKEHSGFHVYVSGRLFFGKRSC